MIGKTLLFFIIIFIMLSYFNCYAQKQAGLAFIIRSNPMHVQKKTRGVHKNFTETSEIKLFGMCLIRFYQLFISTQDMPVCNFTPSCSQFGMQSIRKYGFLRGLILASDRLQRCHGSSRRYFPRYYTLDERTGRLFDPVENYSKESLNK